MAMIQSDIVWWINAALDVGRGSRVTYDMPQSPNAVRLGLSLKRRITAKLTTQPTQTDCSARGGILDDNCMRRTIDETYIRFSFVR